MQLSFANLIKIASTTGTIGIPSYDRTQIEPGILHIGVGNFYSSHLASYMEDLMEQDFDHAKTWGFVGAAIPPRGKVKQELLQGQDCLQTVVEQDADIYKPRILGCMIDFLDIDPNIVAKKLQDPAIKIVSLTVTEGGYFLSDGKFDISNPNIQHDIQNPDNPKTIFGLLCQAAQYRKQEGLIPFSVLSCDNIPHNGDMTRSVIIGLAKEQDESLAAWMDENIGFPSSMVDRITPVTTQEQIDSIKDKCGYDDAAPVFCEPFRQWVLEDAFSVAGCPRGWDKLENVQFVPDVAPYEFMKIRTLNGGHASLCYPAALLDIEYVHETLQHSTISSFLDVLERTEIIPTIPPVPDTDLEEYWNTIAKRFSNPTLKDTIPRICFDGFSRQPQFIVPTIEDNLEQSNMNRSVNGLALVSAMWCRYCQGVTESGKEIDPNDPQWDKLHKLALQVKDDGQPQLWLQGLPDVYGSTKDSSVFVEAFTAALNRIESDGVEAAMKHYISTSSKTDSDMATGGREIASAA